LHRAPPSRGTLPSGPRGCKPRATIREICRREHGAPQSRQKTGKKNPAKRGCSKLKHQTRSATGKQQHEPDWQPWHLPAPHGWGTARQFAPLSIARQQQKSAATLSVLARTARFFQNLCLSDLRIARMATRPKMNHTGPLSVKPYRSSGCYWAERLNGVLGQPSDLQLWRQSHSRRRPRWPSPLAGR